MADQVVVYICDTQAQAVTAREFLLTGGFAAADIVVAEKVDDFQYDAEKYSANQKRDDRAGVWVVIGRK